MQDCDRDLRGKQCAQCFGAVLFSQAPIIKESKMSELRFVVNCLGINSETLWNISEQQLIQIMFWFDQIMKGKNESAEVQSLEKALHEKVGDKEMNKILQNLVKDVVQAQKTEDDDEEDENDNDEEN